MRESYLSDMDLILVEGYKSEAVVSDDTLAVKVPVFSPHDPQSLADFLEERFLRKRQKEEIQLMIDGHRVALNPFVQHLFRSLLLAMVAPLKGIGQFSRIALRLDTSMQMEDSTVTDP